MISKKKYIYTIDDDCFVSLFYLSVMFIYNACMPVVYTRFLFVCEFKFGVVEVVRLYFMCQVDIYAWIQVIYYGVKYSYNIHIV